MKQAFIVSGKSPKNQPGGLGAYAFNTAKIFKELGYEVFIIAFADKDEDIDLGFARLIHVRTPWNRLASVGIFLITPFLARRMAQIARERNLRHAIVYSAGLWGSVGVRFKRLVPECRVSTYVGYFSTYDHDYGGQVVGCPISDYGICAHLFVRGLHAFARIVFKPAEHCMLKNSDRIVVHYESTRRILLDEISNLDPARISKLPYYIDVYSRSSSTKFAKSFVRDPALPTVGVICRQDPRKGINTFLKSVKEMYGNGIEFNCLVVGSGFFLERHKALAEKLGLGARVVFAGFVESVEDVLEAIDVYVLPSVEEGSGAISLLEAMQHGVAIVTTMCDGIPEDFVNEETGLLVPMNDPHAMARALTRLVESRELRDRLAANVRADYAKRFTFEKMKSGIAQLIQSGG